MYSQYPQSPYGPPQPPPKKKTNYWLVGCFGCGGLLVILAGIAIIIAVVVNSGDDSGGSASDSPSSSEDAGSGGGSGGGGEETAPADNGEPVSIAAESIEYVPSAISSGEDFVAVHVTVTNNGEEPLSVNPLYFSMEDSSGSTVDADLMESSGQDDLFEAKDLAPGESEDGVIVFPGSSEPVNIMHTGVMGTEYSAEVS